jgi:hypothetical protein
MIIHNFLAWLARNDIVQRYPTKECVATPPPCVGDQPLVALLTTPVKIKSKRELPLAHVVSLRPNQ